MTGKAFQSLTIRFKYGLESIISTDVVFPDGIIYLQSLLANTMPDNNFDFACLEKGEFP